MPHKSFPVFESDVVQGLVYCGFTCFNIGVCFKITASTSKYTCSKFSYNAMEAEIFSEKSFTICCTIRCETAENYNLGNVTLFCFKV